MFRASPRFAHLPYPPDVRGDPMAARPITNSALEFRERRRKDDYGLGHAGELRRKAHDTVEKSYPIYGERGTGWA